MNNQRFGFYGFFGAIALALLVSKLMGCASPASADNQADPAPSTASVVIETEGSWASAEDGSRIVLRTSLADTDDASGMDAASAPIVALDDALFAAGLNVGDEILVVTDGFDSLTVTSAGSLDLAFSQIESAVASDDSYIDILVLRDGHRLWLTRAEYSSES